VGKLNETKRVATMSLALLPALAFFFLLTPGTVNGEEKITIGAMEDVILLPWGVRLPARIDTGAAKSSLDARDLKIDGDTAEFRLPPQYGGLQLRLPIVEWRHVRSPEARKRRPVVEMELCLDSKRIRGKVNLTDRSLVKYPLIVGRNFLKENFLVDVRKQKTAPPACSDTP